MAHLLTVNSNYVHYKILPRTSGIRSDIFAPARYIRQGHFHNDGANLQIQSHFVPSIMLQNLAFKLETSVISLTSSFS